MAFENDEMDSHSDASTIESSDITPAKQPENKIDSVQEELSSSEAETPKEPSQEHQPVQPLTNGIALPSTFFAHLYRLPMVNDVVEHVRSAAEQNKYTASLLGYTQAFADFAAGKSYLLKSVQKPLGTVDAVATQCLEKLEKAYPVLTKPTPIVMETLKDRCHTAETKCPFLAKAAKASQKGAEFAVTSAEKVVDLVLPPEDSSKKNDDANTNENNASSQSQPESCQTQCVFARAANLSFNTIPSRIYICGQRYRDPVRRFVHNPKESIHTVIITMGQKSKETSALLMTRICEGSQKIVQSSVCFVKDLDRKMPEILPKSLVPCYNSFHAMFTTKYAKLREEVANKDESSQEKFVNIIRISGEQVPLLEPITHRFYEKASSELEFHHNASGTSENQAAQAN